MPSGRRPNTFRTVAVAAACAVVAAACVAPGPSDPPPAASPVRSITFPLATAVSFGDSFGAPRSGGRSHEGQDLMAPKGTIAVAAASGTVTFLRHSSDGLSGNMLRITDADGWQYVYIHLNNDTPGTDDGANVYDQAFVDGIRKGQKVVAGEPIAFVGDSGNAEHTGAHLHFEIRSPDGAAVNAYSSLRHAPVAPRGLLDVIAAAPFGSVDVIANPSTATLTATGWAMDRVTDDPVAVSLYVDGNPVATTLADLPRPDVAAAHPTRTGDHGFEVVVAGIVPGPHRVCVVFHNAGAGGGSLRAGCAIPVVA